MPRHLGCGWGGRRGRPRDPYAAGIWVAARRRRVTERAASLISQRRGAVATARPPRRACGGRRASTRPPPPTGPLRRPLCLRHCRLARPLLPVPRQGGVRVSHIARGWWGSSTTLSSSLPVSSRVGRGRGGEGSAAPLKTGRCPAVVRLAGSAISLRRRPPPRTEDVGRRSCGAYTSAAPFLPIPLSGFPPCPFWHMPFCHTCQPPPPSPFLPLDCSSHTSPDLILPCIAPPPSRQDP